MRHFYEDIPGWAAFRNLYTIAVKDAPSDRVSVFVEVGSWLGRSAAYMGVEIANHGKPIRFHCVDPWEDGGPDLRDTTYFKSLQRPVFEEFKRNTAPVAHLIKPLRMTSVHGAACFEDGSVDFLMLDGDHSYEAVKADIAAWLPKMRPGGMMAGDDALWPGVKLAVEEAFGNGAKIHVISQNKDYKMSASYWHVRLP